MAHAAPGVVYPLPVYDTVLYVPKILRAFDTFSNKKKTTCLVSGFHTVAATSLNGACAGHFYVTYAAVDSCVLDAKNITSFVRHFRHRGEISAGGYISRKG